MQFNRYIFIIIFFAGILITCKKDDTPDVLRTPDEFYPLQVGKYITWSVDSIIIHETVDDDTSHFEVKELIADTFYDNEQRLNYKIERYIRSSDTSDWSLQNVWSILNTGNEVQKVENNLRFVKLVAPVSYGVEWEGNIYIGGTEDLPSDEDCNKLPYLEGWVYHYSDMDVPESLNGFDFDKTIKVLQEGDSNFIWYNYAEETYASGVGMIQKDFYHYWTNDITCPDCPWEERAQCGYSIKMKIIDYN